MNLRKPLPVCPICGGEISVYKSFSDRDMVIVNDRLLGGATEYNWFLECSNCGEGPTGNCAYYKSEQGAVRAWRRVSKRIEEVRAWRQAEDNDLCGFGK